MGSTTLWIFTCGEEGVPESEELLTFSEASILEEDAMFPLPGPCHFSTAPADIRFLSRNKTDSVLRE